MSNNINDEIKEDFEQDFEENKNLGISSQVSEQIEENLTNKTSKKRSYFEETKFVESDSQEQWTAETISPLGVSQRKAVKTTSKIHAEKGNKQVEQISEICYDKSKIMEIEEPK